MIKSLNFNLRKVCKIYCASGKCLFRDANANLFFVLLLLVNISGCGVKRGLIELAPGVKRPKIALVLGGGAARGFAHIGVIRTLEQEKIPIDLIVGTSVGSLVGAIYADRANSFELEWEAFALEKDDIFDFSILRAKKGPVKGDKLEKFIHKHIDLNTGEEVVLDKGSIAKAIRASSSIPGIFEPLKYQKRLLIDGGALGSIAPEIARQKGADVVITVDIGKNIANYDTDNVVTITLQAINIMSNKIDRYKQKETDILIQPDVSDVGIMDFSEKKKCMLARIKATKSKISEIKKVISEW